MQKNYVLYLLFFLLFLYKLNAQSQSNDIVIDNKIILQLKSLDISNDIIVNKLQTAKNTSFDFSNEQLIILKKSGIDFNILSAMLNKHYSTLSISNTLNNNTSSTTTPVITNNGNLTSTSTNTNTSSPSPLKPIALENKLPNKPLSNSRNPLISTKLEPNIEQIGWMNSYGFPYQKYTWNNNYTTSLISLAIEKRKSANSFLTAFLIGIGGQVLFYSWASGSGSAGALGYGLGAISSLTTFVGFWGSIYQAVTANSTLRSAANSYNNDLNNNN